MAPGAYRIRIWLINFDVERAVELREELGRTMRRAGPARLKAVLREVHEGGRVNVYQTNSRRDAEIVANRLARCGGEVEVVG